MADYTITASDGTGIYNGDSDYAVCHEASIGTGTTGPAAGQAHLYNDEYYIYRGYLKFSLQGIISGFQAIAATLKLYITETNCESDDLDSYEMTLVSCDFNENSTLSTYNDFGTTSLGALTITDDMPEAIYSITFNSDGLAAINAALDADEDYFYLGLRSDQDIDATAPDKGSGESAFDYIVYDEDETSLEITTALSTGVMTIAVYSAIKSLIEELTASISDIVSSGNIILDADEVAYIHHESPLLAPETISKNDLANGVKFSSLSSDSTITTCDGLDVEALTNTTLTTTGNATVTDDLNINSTGYASIKEQIEHDNLWWEATSNTPSVDATKAKIYQELSTGDLKITINSGGQTKTAILADFSAL